MRPILLVALTTSLFAQPGVPSAVYHAPEKERQAAPTRRFALRPAAERWMAPLTDEERNARRVRAGLTQIAVHRAARAEDLRGTWETARDGSAVWRLALRSPGAAAIRLHLEEFHAGDGRLWITEMHGNEPQTFGPYSGEGIHGDGEFWSNAALGEAVLIEYEPAGRSRSLPFRIAEISHFTSLPVAIAKPDAELTLAKAGETRNAALSCNIDVTCRPEYAELARAVARISFETDEGGALCSGTVLNTRSNSMIPYFLTAAHCISSDAEARTVEAYFLYQTSTCNGPAPSAASVRRVVGARYMAGSSVEGGDFTLLRLNSVPDGTVFAGWSSTAHPVGAAVTGIHHPTGDLKKISFGARGTDLATRGRPVQNFYTIIWNEGVTEGGSSGSGIFNEQRQLVGMLSGGPRAPAGQTECDLRPAFDWYGRFDVAFPQIRSLLEDDGTDPGPGPVTPATGTLLTSGAAQAVTLPAVTNSTLFGGNLGYRIVVPQGATELEISLATSTANADVDLFASFEQQPAIVSGRVQADHSSATDSGNERIVINAQSTPPLRAGTYFIALASFTTGREIQATLTARVGSPAPGTSETTLLTNGTARTFSLPAVTSGTLFRGPSSYRIEVPANASQLQIRVATATPNADVDLYARFGAEPAVEGGRANADYRSVSDTGNEIITIDAQSTPPLQEGTYYIALGLFTTGTAVNGTIVAEFTTPVSVTGPPPVALNSGVSRTVSLPATVNPVLFTGEYAYQITVPEGSSGLRVELRPDAFHVDADLFVKRGALARLIDGRPDTEYRSEGPDGNETVDISSGLLPGIYYIQLINYTSTEPFTGTIVATVERNAPAPTLTTTLVSGVPAKLQLPSVENAALFRGNYSYKIDVPEGSTRLTIRLNTATPNADVDLYARFATDIGLSSGGEVVADHFSESPTGNEVIVISSASNPTLRAGTYFIATALFTRGTPVTGTVTATVERAPTTTPTVGRELPFNETVQFSLPAVNAATFFGGNNLLRVNVTQPGGLRFELRSLTPNVDLDLHVRYQQPPAIENGRIVADFNAAGDTGNEDLTIAPNFIGDRFGTYYVAVSLYTRNVPVTATLRVIPIAPGASDEKREVLPLRKESGLVKAKPRLREE